MPETELAACPFCHGRPAVKKQTGVTGTACKSRYYRERVVCRSCGVSTPEYKRPQQAFTAWNRRAAPASVAELQAEVARCHARLEIDHHFIMNNDHSGLVRVDVPLSERDKEIDGIEARDCTIKGQDEQIEKLRSALAKSEAAREAAEARVAAFEEALKPSGDTKADYSGEIEITLTRIDEFGDEVSDKRLLPWTVIKDVMALIRNRAAQSFQEPRP